MARWGAWSSGIGWLTALSVAAVAAINLAGIGGIAVARRGALDEAERVLRLETAGRARAMESVLSSTRADLAFLTGSPIFFGLESALASRDPRVARWRRLEAEGALLLFLRGHPEVMHLTARSESGNSLIEAARRGGVPVLWMSSANVSPEIAGKKVVDVARGPVTGRFTFSEGARRVSGAVILEATLDAARLFSISQALEDPSRSCALRDRQGNVLAAEPQARAAQREADGADHLQAESAVATEEWSAPAPWKLSCERDRAAVLARVEPLAGRYRMTLLLNLAVMSLALLLGAFAVLQTRRRQILEAGAREEARVRDLERQLFHAERLGTVGRLAAGIAHEINNPLEGISNYLGLAREDLAKGDAASARRRMDGIQEGLQRAVSIVRQVLAHADPSGAPLVPLDLSEVLRQSADFVRTRPEFAAIRFDLKIPDGPLSVRGSSAMLGQVFLNLLLNACEAQPRGGEVLVEVRREKERLVAEIADGGPGVPRDEAARIFEPFFSTKHSTGLGLSICYSIARHHGAELSVADRPGGGAIFRLSFPREEADHD
jgi:signal transduction histidine kinase